METFEPWSIKWDSIVYDVYDTWNGLIVEQDVRIEHVAAKSQCYHSPGKIFKIFYLII